MEGTYTTVLEGKLRSFTGLSIMAFRSSMFFFVRAFSLFQLDRYTRRRPNVTRQSFHKRDALRAVVERLDINL